MGDQNTYFDFCTVDLHSDAPAENSKMSIGFQV